MTEGTGKDCVIQHFLHTDGKPLAAIFMSGAGSNAEALLESLRGQNDASWSPAVIVSDAPEKSRARVLARKFKIFLLEHDIKKFYAERGESRVSLMSENGRRIREEWTNELREKLSPYNIDFGILAGFVPLSNITSDFPCLNVHPGDLTVEENGRRILVGLHTLPIETAMLKGFDSLRSSVILAQPYSGIGGEMDTGPVLGVSGPVKIDFQGHSLDELKQVSRARPAQRPVGGYKDLLEEVAKHNQELLKESGDWVVFPPVTSDFAAGKYACDQEGALFYDMDGTGWRKIKTVFCDGAKKEIIL